MREKRNMERGTAVASDLVLDLTVHGERSTEHKCASAFRRDFVDRI